jgi:DNA-binding YbaB/EbfC family protein
MFKEMGQIFQLMRNLPKLKEEAERIKNNLAQLTAEGDAGAGMVRVRVNGKMEVLQCQISDEALQLGDKEMLEDLVRSATNQALEKVRKLAHEETTKLAAGLGLPPGVELPEL